MCVAMVASVLMELEVYFEYRFHRVPSFIFAGSFMTLYICNGPPLASVLLLRCAAPRRRAAL